MVIWGHYSTIQYTKICFGKFGYFVHNTELCQTVLLTAGTSTAFDTLPSPSEQDFFYVSLCAYIPEGKNSSISNCRYSCTLFFCQYNPG